MTLITIAALRAAGATQAKAEELLDAMKLGAAFYSVDTPLRIAHFLAQVGHESGGFVHVREVWGPTDAQKRYEGRRDLGNVHQGDGIRFLGRDYMQTTGRNNYAALRDRLRKRLPDVPDFELHPEELEDPPWSVLGAFDYWGMNNLNAAADTDDCDLVSDKVNIGHPTKTRGDANGFADRERRLKAIKAALAAESPIAQEARLEQLSPPAEVAAAGAFPDDALIEQALAPSQEKPMVPMLIPVVLQALSALVPQLGSIFGSGSEVSQRNLKAAEVVITAAKGAAGAVNEQELLEKIQAGDPAIVSAVTDAVKTVYFEVVEAGGGGIAAARNANVAAAAQPGAGFKTPAFAVTMALLPLVYMTVYYVLTGDFASEVKSMVIAAVVSGILGSVAGFWLGSSFSSQRKDERGKA